MEAGLIERWNRFVRTNDEVWHLGDFGFQKPSDLIEIVKRLNGKIRLVPGNHDGRSFLNKLYELPEDKVVVCDKYMELNHNNRKFVLCHYPIESWANMSHGSIHLHGHSHGSSREVHGRFDVGVDSKETGYAPVHIDRIIEWAQNQPKVSRPDRSNNGV
jgi:calcineurin-like phosphoesterase family protein